MAQAKQLIILLILSLLAIFFKTELLAVLHGIAYVYQHIAAWFNSLLPQGPWIKLLVLSILLFIIPLIIAAAIGGIGCLFKKNFNKFFVPATWVCWLIVCAAVIIQGT
jgi:hypothetical protein